jgi:hypothetical protein
MRDKNEKKYQLKNGLKTKQIAIKKNKYQIEYKNEMTRLLTIKQNLSQL